MSECTHHWTVTSACPYCQSEEIAILKAEVKEAWDVAQRTHRVNASLRETISKVADGDIWMRVFVAYVGAGNSTKTDVGIFWADRAVEAYRERFGGK